MIKKNKQIYDFFLESGLFFITGEINSNTYLDFAQGIRYTKSLDISPVKIYINSHGGDLEAALAIIDDFRVYEKDNKEIYTIAIGECCSSAAVILAYGSKRFATSAATIMIHPVSYDLGESEHQSTKSYVTFADRLYNNTMTDLAMRCGKKDAKSIKSFITNVRDGYWMDADGAIDLGIIDEKWDYSLE